mmetsp:Transcript_6196/g.12982  ORF Transcript_6196/g.12982 Transcript_6196/m.12982 type:complete len:258 (-) Transcript_6196:1412-2185(-)
MASIQEDTLPPELILVKGLLSDKFAEKEAKGPWLADYFLVEDFNLKEENSPSLEKHFAKEFHNFQQKIDDIFLDNICNNDRELSDGEQKFCEDKTKIYNDDNRDIILDGDGNGNLYDGVHIGGLLETIGYLHDYDGKFCDNESKFYDGDEDSAARTEDTPENLKASAEDDDEKVYEGIQNFCDDDSKFSNDGDGEIVLDGAGKVYKEEKFFSTENIFQTIFIRGIKQKRRRKRQIFLVYAPKENWRQCLQLEEANWV